MGLDELLNAIQHSRTIQDHPDWTAFKTKKFPQFLSFYYTNEKGDRAYWDQARVIKLDLKNLHLIVEGSHGDPLKFDIYKITGSRDVKTGERVQELFIELIRMWEEIHQENNAPE